MKLRREFLLIPLATCFFPLQAAWIKPQWKNFCARLLMSPFPKRARSMPEIRREYNRHAIRTNEVQFISEGAPAIAREVLSRDRVEWLGYLHRRSVDWILDQNLPLWRSDRDWYFQPRFDIWLYTSNSNGPIYISRDEVILMNDEFAIGKISRGPRPGLELFE